MGDRIFMVLASTFTQHASDLFRSHAWNDAMVSS